MDPFIISSIILAIAFLTILLFNFKLKSKVIKYSFLIYFSLFLLLIILYDNNFVYEFLKQMITYLWYPNYLLFVITVICDIIIIIYTLFKEKLNNVSKIINYINLLIAFACYIIFLRLNIDPNIYSEYYKSTPLMLVRITTISFLISLIINIIIKIRGKYEQ